MHYTGWSLRDAERFLGTKSNSQIYPGANKSNNKWWEKVFNKSQNRLPK